MSDTVSILSEENETNHADIRPEFSKIFLGLRRESDPRPKSVLLTGNGFTLGLLSELQLLNQFPCSLENIFSPNKQIKYISVDKEDSFQEQVLWSSILWPKLTSHLENLEFDLDKLWQSFINGHNLNQSRATDRWSINETNLAFEIRWYIWFYFRNTLKLYPQLYTGIRKWSWVPVLEKLINEYKLSYVTFNYDLLFDVSLRMMGQYVWPVIIEEKEALNKLPVNSIPAIKVHGSFEHMLPRDGMLGGNIRKPWLTSGIINHKNRINNQPLLRIQNYGDIKFFEEWPWLPEIVPPGRPGDDLCHPHNIAGKYAKAEIDDCDVLIICGLSANEPDTTEIKELLSTINKQTKIIHIDLDPENSAPNMCEILINSGCEYIPIKSSELNKLLKYI